jgi:homoserine dehydrogenase
VAEANADYDVEGWDASVKAVVLADVLMGAEIHPADVAREGIRGISGVDVRSALERGMAIRLVARGLKDEVRVKLSVAPEMIPIDSLLGATRGTTNALILQTDLMGEIAIVETDPGVEQTAYALLSDMLTVRRFIGEAND